MMYLEQSNTHFLDLLKKALCKCADKESLYTTVVNAPFANKYESTRLDLGIVVLLIVNEHTHMIDRVALSDTELAKGAVRMSAKPFKEIKIPLDYTDNFIVQAIQSNELRQTEDWEYLFIPALSPDQARFNQSGAGIESSTVVPLSTKKGGALIFSCYQPLSNITSSHIEFMKSYASLVSERLNEINAE